jgi:hypothetical protein
MHTTGSVYKLHYRVLPRAMVVCSNVQYGSIENYTAYHHNKKLRHVYVVIPCIFFCMIFILLFSLSPSEALKY